ncbi:MAG: 4-hydroxy-3-methylbut-2-enyl diphosphate reductase [Eubacteriales bacterium]|nr:4-hydroxy-3-methylbut-2-enyl diphosphate reductase [Eubacteriales bacterium]
MNVKLAESAGFCYGVERAVNAVCAEIAKGSAGIYTYGPIVHNDAVVRSLADKGVKVIKNFAELKSLAESGELDGATVIIRAHGVGKDVTDLLTRNGQPELSEAGIGRKGINVVDATCPFVKKIHKTVVEHYRAGEGILVTGSAEHPEVIGILGQINNDAVVLESVSDAEQIIPDNDRRYCLVSQTTFNVQKFKDIVDILQKKLYDVNIVDTICNATQLRQKEALALSRECDAMIVIGGRHSSNTQKLYDICSKECSMTYLIESLQDFTEKPDSSVRCVGITAGASTPKTIIQEVLKYVRDEF